MQRWNDWLDSLPALQDVEISRCVKPSGFELKSSQLHCFCDASQTGCGAVIYMRSVSVTGEIHCSFIVARSRVAPIKPVTIPRMELIAAVVGVELTTFLNNICKHIYNQFKLLKFELYLFNLRMYLSSVFLYILQRYNRKIDYFGQKRFSKIHTCVCGADSNY